MRIFLWSAVVLAALSCSRPARHSAVVVNSDFPPGSMGVYEKDRVSVTMRTLEGVLGPTSVLSQMDRDKAWEDVEGKQIHWTGYMVEVGEVYPTVVPVKLNSESQEGAWDILAYFDPQYAASLRRRQVGNAIGFTGILQNYELTPDGIRVTVRKARLLGE